MRDDVERILISAEALEERVAQMGAEITRDYRGKELVLLSILKGSLYFTADLVRAIRLPLVLDFMAISSYGDGITSSGEVKILKDIEEDIRGRHVLIVEDIVDTGITLEYLMKILHLKSPASVAVCTLLEKPAHRERNVSIHYLGFSIPDEFVVGYGLDYVNKYRHLPFVCVMKRERVIH